MIGGVLILLIIITPFELTKFLVNGILSFNGILSAIGLKILDVRLK